MSKLDGGELKRDYCAGLLSIQDVAKKHGIAKTTLIDMAKKYGWERKKKPSKTPTKKTDQNKNGRTVEPKASRSEKRTRSGQENSDTDLSIDPDDYGITLQQAWFAHWFVITKSRVEAYKRAGYRCEGKNAYFGASQVYRNIKVSKAIRDLEAKASKRYQADLDDLIDQLVAIINADPRELSHFRRVNCRHCWGENFFYQWIDINEYDTADAKATAENKPKPQYGGVGFVENADPNPDCPRCNGEGVGETFFADVRDLQGHALQYFVGVKESKFGIEILTEDKKAARAQLLQLLTFRRAEKLQQLQIENQRLVNAKLAAEIGDDDDEPQPVAININVVDARGDTDEPDA
ncbi:terminase small subunit [Serratia fonticola]|nr:terminase small subunit [Serratia fonticola]